MKLQTHQVTIPSWFTCFLVVNTGMCDLKTLSSIIWIWVTELLGNKVSYLSKLTHTHAHTHRSIICIFTFQGPHSHSPTYRGLVIWLPLKWVIFLWQHLGEQGEKWTSGTFRLRQSLDTHQHTLPCRVPYRCTRVLSNHREMRQGTSPHCFPNPNKTKTAHTLNWTLHFTY